MCILRSCSLDTQSIGSCIGLCLAYSGRRQILLLAGTYSLYLKREASENVGATLTVALINTLVYVAMPLQCGTVR